MRLEAALRPGNSPPVDMFPILKRLPEFVAPWKTRCKEVRKQQREIFFGMLDLVIERLKNEQGNECFMEYVVERQKHYNLDREMLGYVFNTFSLRMKSSLMVVTSYLGGSLLQAGIDTTAIFLQSMVACIITHPHVQLRAQQEIDDVIGPDRTPDFPDIENLPYIRALINEVGQLGYKVTV